MATDENVIIDFFVAANEKGNQDNEGDLIVEIPDPLGYPPPTRLKRICQGLWFNWLAGSKVWGYSTDSQELEAVYQAGLNA